MEHDSREGLVELGRYHDNSSSDNSDVEEPDSPLLLPTNATQPRWFSSQQQSPAGSTRRHRSWKSLFSSRRSRNRQQRGYRDHESHSTSSAARPFLRTGAIVTAAMTSLTTASAAIVSTAHTAILHSNEDLQLIRTSSSSSAGVGADAITKKACPLPRYTGPYDVGAVDIEVELEKPRRVADTILKSTGQPAFEVETVLFTVYYPVSKKAKAKRHQHYWIPKPISLTAEGYAKLAHVNNAIMRPIFTFALWLVGGGIHIPGKVDAPILGSTQADQKTDPESDKKKFPVMVFSHGMASSRTDYTNFLGELASRGHVIAAIEHRDGSSPGTMVMFPPNKEKKEGEQRKDHKVLPLRVNDLLSDPPMDTPRIKREQLAFRDVEIFETINALKAINNGKGADIYAANPRKEGSTLPGWEGRLDFSQLTIGGHSYGATGALQALKSEEAADAIGGIILDPGKESGPLNANVSVPILVVHSNTWSKAHSLFYGRPHFDTVRDIAEGALERSGASWFLTSVGTSHPSVTDAALIEPLILSWATGATTNPKAALGEYVNVAMDFFSFLEKGVPNPGILTEPVTHEKYGKWVSDERKKEFPKNLAKYWEVHVTPAI